MRLRPGDRHAGAARAGDGRVRNAVRAAGRPELWLRPRQPLHARHDRARRRPLQGHRGRRERRVARRAQALKRAGSRRRRVERHALRPRPLSRRAAAPRKLAALDMFVDIQVEHDQLVRMAPLLARLRRADPRRSLRAPRRVMQASTSRASGRCSSSARRARLRQALGLRQVFAPALAARGRVARSSRRCRRVRLDHCLWASDWPYLRAPARVDYGVLLTLVLALFPDAAERRTLFWETPRATVRLGLVS